MTCLKRCHPQLFFVSLTQNERAHLSRSSPRFNKKLKPKYLARNFSHSPRTVLLKFCKLIKRSGADGFFRGSAPALIRNILRFDIFRRRYRTECDLKPTLTKHDALRVFVVSYYCKIL